MKILMVPTNNTKCYSNYPYGALNKIEKSISLPFEHSGQWSDDRTYIVTCIYNLTSESTVYLVEG